jgi:protease I
MAGSGQVEERPSSEEPMDTSNGSRQSEQASDAMATELSGTRVAILAETLYEDLELWYPYYRLREAGADVFVVGSGSAETYQSKHGYPVTVDAEADTVTASQFDAIVIPGGYSPDHMRRHPAMVKLVREAYEQHKIVAAICHAGWMLASANVVRGRTATSFRSIKDDMVNAGAVWVDREVVRDDNLVTSRTPADLPAFMRTIITALRERRTSDRVEREVALIS